MNTLRAATDYLTGGSIDALPAPDFEWDDWLREQGYHIGAEVEVEGSMAKIYGNPARSDWALYCPMVCGVPHTETLEIHIPKDRLHRAIDNARRNASMVRNLMTVGGISLSYIFCENCDSKKLMVSEDFGTDRCLNCGHKTNEGEREYDDNLM